MTAPKRKPSRSARLADQEKRHRRHVRSPCDRPPITPANPIGEFDRLGTPRYHRLRAKFRWDEVHEDTSGFHITIRHYEVELQYSAQDAQGTWFDAERYMVPPKDDNEPNDKAHLVVKGSIVGNLAYRWRVRTIADGGCKSTWTAYQFMGDPGNDNPPAPMAVTIYDGSLDRVVVDWDPSPDPGDDEILDERVAHYGVEISGHQDFSPIYKRDIFVHGTQRTFKVGAAHLGDQFFARAWAVGTDRDKSAKIPAKLGGNSDPSALPDGVTVELSKVASGHEAWWPGTIATIPSGWLLEDGSLYSTTVYAELFAVLGYRHGGSGGQFAVPDVKGRHRIGVSSRFALGADEGLTEDLRDVEHDHPAHKHAHAHDQADSQTEPPLDSTPAVPGQGGQPEGVHVHNAGAMQTGNPLGGQSAQPAGGNVAGSGHFHDVVGQTSTQPSPHDHPHGHGSHPHPHGHGSHGHPHAHPANNTDQNAADKKKRPHKASHPIIKT